MKSIIKTFSSILALIFLAIVCGYSYFYIGFPSRKNGIERLNSVAHVKFSDRVVYFGDTGGLDDWQDYFKFNATKEEVEIIVLQLELEKTAWFNFGGFRVTRQAPSRHVPGKKS
jgi:preprotein translocase subunit YajC